MHLFMPWFLPVGIALGVFGSRTAVAEKRARGGHWRTDSLALALTVWAPLAIWIVVCLTGPYD